MSISPQAPESDICLAPVTFPIWRDQVQQMLYSNAVSRRARHYVHEARMELPLGRVDEMWYLTLLNMVKMHGGVCFVTGPVCIPTSVAIAVERDGCIYLLRNPLHIKQMKTSESMLAVMDAFSLCFTDISSDPVQYWQQMVEPTQVSSYSFR